MEENKNIEMEQEIVEERRDEETRYVEDPCTELEEMSANEIIEEPGNSSGVAFMALGAAVVVGAYVGGKWVFKKGKKFVQKKLDERAEKRQQKVSDDEINGEFFVVEDYDEDPENEEKK